MPTIVSTEDFKSGQLFIPNSQSVPDIGNGEVSAVQELQSFIDKYEKLLLVNALGIVQYNELKLNQEQVSGKWFDLINGKEYGDKVWIGLKPIIASFVYCKYLENDKTYYTTVGIERSQSKNSISVNPTADIVEVWNSFIEMYQGIFNCDYSIYFYPYFYLGNWDFENSDKNTYDSLSEYLKAFPNDYSKDFFRHYELKNSLGL